MSSLREGYTRMLLQHPTEPGVFVEDIDLGGVPAKRVAPVLGAAQTTLVYFHGGAYLFGSAQGYVPLASRLALGLQAEVIVPDYRLAPEHPYPTPIMDCIAAYESILEEGYDPEQIVFAGDSAGGALTVSVMLHARRRGLPLPKAGVAISPWVELEHRGESMRTRDGIDPLCTREALDQQASAFLGGAQPTEPDASPVHADLQGLPPFLIHIGEAEVMLSGAIELADRMAKQRVRVSLEVWPGMFHVWHMFAAVLPEGQNAIERIADFVRFVRASAEAEPTPVGAH